MLFNQASWDAICQVLVHDQMAGHVLGGRVAAQFNGVTLKVFGMCLSGIVRTDLGLSHYFAGQTEDTANAQCDLNQFAANGQAKELSPSPSLGGKILAPAERTVYSGELFLNGKDRLASFVPGASVVVALHP